MESNFKVKCPYCSEINDFSGDDWHDELVDDSDHSHIKCLHCDLEIEIITHAVYTLEVVEPEISDLEKEILAILRKAKNAGLSMHGDEIIGYFFKGEGYILYDKELNSYLDKNHQHWQEIDINFENLIKSSGITLTPYKREDKVVNCYKCNGQGILYPVFNDGPGIQCEECEGTGRITIKITQ